MWHRRFVASLLVLPTLHGAKSGQSKATALCPLCFVPSLPDNVQDVVKRGQVGNGFAWMWFGPPLRLSPGLLLWEGGLWLQNRVGFKQAGELGWIMSPGGRLSVSSAFGRGVDVALPSRSGRIPLFISAYQENSSPANRGGSRAAAMGPVTHSQPGAVLHDHHSQGSHIASNLLPTM